MKGFGGDAPFFLVLLSIFAFFFDTRKRRSKPTSIASPEESDIWEEEKKREEQQNTEAAQRLVEAHADCTAEVINIIVWGWGRVYDFRKLRPGDPVEISRHKGEFKVFSHGRYIADLYPGKESRLPRIFDESIPFEAYLGGRDMRNAYVETERDYCSIIIFYRIPGVAPTKVNLL